MPLESCAAAGCMPTRWAKESNTCAKTLASLRVKAASSLLGAASFLPHPALTVTFTAMLAACLEAEAAWRMPGMPCAPAKRWAQMAAWRRGAIWFYRCHALFIERNHHERRRHRRHLERPDRDLQRRGIRFHRLCEPCLVRSIEAVVHSAHRRLPACRPGAADRS